MKNKKWFTPYEAAKEIGCTGAYVRALFNYGELDGMRLSDGPKARIRILQSSVNNFIKSRLNAPSLKDRLGDAA